MSDYLDRLSEFASGVTYRGLSESARKAASSVVMDTLGAILAGSRLQENANLADFVARTSEGGSATLLGHPLKAPPMMAALANATAGVSLEMDEGTRLGGGHPAIHILPGALAVAEEMVLGGEALMEALVAGYEVSSRIGGASVTGPNVHSHGTWGTIGTAVAVARLKGLVAGAMRQAINLSASMSPANSWTPCFEGATIRNLYPGRSGMQGVLAVQLLECGFTALQDSPTDLYSTVLGTAFDGETAVSGLGVEALRIEQNYFKFHACCLYNHPVLDAVAALVDSNEFGAQDVARVMVTTVPFAQRMAQGLPDNMLSAKFHIPYAVAVLLTKGRSDVSAFLPQAVEDPEVRHLAQRVEVETEPAMSMLRSDYPCARVTVALKDGRTLTESTTFVRGDFENRRSEEELQQKFNSLTSPSLGEDGVGKVISVLDHLQDLKDVRKLTALLRG